MPKDLLLVGSSLSLSFGRLGDRWLCFPDGWSSSGPCGRFNRGRHEIVCLSSSKQVVQFLFARLGLSLERPQWQCSAITGGTYELPLPENEGPDNILLAEIRKRKRELAALLEDQSRPALPFWKRQSRALTSRIVELSKRRQLDEVFELLESAKMANRKINRKTMNAVLEACVHCQDIRRAVQVFNGMAAPDSCGVDEISYGTVIKGLGRAGMLDKAFEILESLEAGTAPGGVKLSMIHLNTLINACANAGDAKRARGVLVRYRSVVEDTGPTLVTYNMLIKGYARSENPLEALKVREEMRLRGMQPNKLTLNSLILAGVRGQDLNMAFEILEEMKEAGRTNPELAPDVVTYTTLIKALASDGDLQGVLDMVAEMKAMKSCVLDRVGYTAIIDACIAAGSPADGLMFLQEMQTLSKDNSQLRPRAHAFLALMRAFAETGDVGVVSWLRWKMISESSGHTWPEDRLEADELLIESAVNDGQLDLATKVLKEIANLTKKLPLSQRGYLAIVRLHAMADFTEDILTPWIIKDEISLDDPLAKLFPELPPLKPLGAAQELSEVITCFCEEKLLPVVDDERKCVGTVHAVDCNQMDASLRDVMREPPPVLLSSASVSEAINTLLEPRVEIVGITTPEETRFITKASLFSFVCR